MIQTHTYLAPLVLVPDPDAVEEASRQYKTILCLPAYDGTEETYHWFEVTPVSEALGLVVLTADETVHAEIAADGDIEGV